MTTQPFIRVLLLPALILAVEPRRLAAAPPQVARAIPDNGDQNVNPGLAVIRITFDQDMSPRGYSICGSLPAGPGKPRWEGRRTVLIPVRLEPDREYSFSVNCPSAQNFTSSSGEPAAVYPVTFRTRSGTGSAPAVPPLTVEQNKRAIQELRRAVDEDYSYRDLRNVDWERQVATYAAAMEKSTSPAEFARHAARVLSAARDVHIWLDADGIHIPTARRTYTANWDDGTLTRIVPGWTQANSCIATGRFDDGLAYIRIRSWGNECREELKAAYAALDAARDARGLVIDVRPNGGGNESLAREFAGCFVLKSAVYSKHAHRDHTRPEGFSEVFERKVEPRRDAPAFRGKVAVLMGPANLSSCESFLLMMKQVPGCRLIGATSGGSSGNPRPVPLPNGVTVYLPSWKDMLPDGTLLEGKGVTPDIEVKAQRIDFATKDPVLEAGLRYLRGQ